MLLSNGERLFHWPLDCHVITAGWTYSTGSAHSAIDLRTNQNGNIIKPVYAAENATVDQVQIWDGRTKTGMQSYGNMVRLRHGDYNSKPLQTRYAHLSSILVKNGDTVTEGQLIGYTGETGNISGAHLHFEVILGGTRVNPLNWLDDDFSVARSTVRLGSYTSVKRPATALAAGAELHLQRVPLYVSSTAVSAAGTVSGTYYVWSAEPTDGRVRITNQAERVGQAGQVTGWISVSDAGVQTQPADKPGTGTTLTIGPVSSGDRDTIRSKCQDLQLLGLYREAEAGGMHTITVGPLSAGDVATLKALCEQLHLVEMGLYKEG